MKNLFAISFLTVAVAQAATVSIAPSSLTPAVGGMFDLSVEISNVNDLFAFQFDIGFNRAVLSALSVSEGPFLPSGGTTAFVPGTIDNNSGGVSVTADSLIGALPGVSGSGVLAEIAFKATAPGVSPISLSNIKLLDSNLGSIDFTSANGSVRVIGTPEPANTWSLLTGFALLAFYWLPRRVFTR